VKYLPNVTAIAQSDYSTST